MMLTVLYDRSARLHQPPSPQLSSFSSSCSDSNRVYLYDLMSWGQQASQERVLEPEDLDDLEDARASLPAHRSRVAISGRDLRSVGRAVPSWRQGFH